MGTLGTLGTLGSLGIGALGGSPRIFRISFGVSSSRAPGLAGRLAPGLGRRRHGGLEAGGVGVGTTGIADREPGAPVRADQAVVLAQLAAGDAGGEVGEAGVRPGLDDGPLADPRLIVAEDADAMDGLARVARVIVGRPRAVEEGRRPPLVVVGDVAALAAALARVGGADEMELQSVARGVEEVQRRRLDVGVVEQALEAGVARVAWRPREVAAEIADRRVGRDVMGAGEGDAELLVQDPDAAVGLAGLLAEVVARVAVLLDGVGRVIDALPGTGPPDRQRGRPSGRCR